MTGMKADLNGRVAIVTGAGRLEGLGFAIATLLAESGASVVICDYDEPSTSPASEALREAGYEVASCSGDATDVTTAERAVRTALDAFGRVDVLVNNAGVWPMVKFLEWTKESWEHCFAINTTAPVLWSQVVARQLIDQGEGGSIVNVTSVAAEVVVIEETLAYESSKAALMHATHGMARTLSEHGIRVNNVLPGPMATGHAKGRGTAPLGYRADPREIAQGVVFLASDLGSFATGADWRIDGGRALGLSSEQAARLLADADRDRREHASLGTR